MNRLFGILLACFIASPAWAGSSTVNYNSTGSAPFRTTTDGSSNNLSQQTIWDYSAGANGAGVDTSHGLLTDPASAPAWGIGAIGSAVPANATYMGMIVGGNLTGIPGTAYGASVDENTSSQLHTDLAAPPNLAYAATYGGCATVTSGNNPWCGDGKSTAYVDIGAVGTAAVLVGAGTTGTGSQRVTAAQDTTTIAGSAPGTAGTPSANVVSVQGVSSGTPVPTQQFSQYPVGSTAVTASATGTTGATTATLPQVASNYNFVCGYSIRANATAATTVTDTLTGVISGTMSSELWVAPAASGIGVDEQIFNPCIPGSAVNTAISAVSGAPGASGLVSSKIWGYYKTTTP